MIKKLLRILQEGKTDRVEEEATRILVLKETKQRRGKFHIGVPTLIAFDRQYCQSQLFISAGEHEDYGRGNSWKF